VMKNNANKYCKGAEGAFWSVWENRRQRREFLLIAGIDFLMMVH
jgi:hypothetical protein